MIRKITALLSAAVLLCSLTACGSKPTENNSSSEAQETSISEAASTEKAVEITTDNWQDYFEITEAPETSENAFGEIEMFLVKKVLVVKSEYAGKIADCDIALEFHADTPKNYIATYNVSTEDFTLTLDEESEFLSAVEPTTETIKVTAHEAAEGAILPSVTGTFVDSTEISDDKMTLTAPCWAFSNIEITRIQGTLTINGTSSTEQTGSTANDSGILELDGRKVITLEALSEHVEIAEITTENWKDYFEIVSSDSEYLLQVRTGGRRYDYTSTLNIDFTNQKTGRIFGGTSDNGQPYICKFDEETSIDDLECQILSPAKIILADIPEELWEVNVDGQNGFYVLTEYDDSHYSYNNVVEYVNGEGKMIPNRLNGLGDLYDE